MEPPAPAPAPAAFTYLGCFRDNEGGRDLTGTGSQNAGGSTAIENANNCVALCAGFQYFGLQWVNECFCDNSYNNGNGNNGNQGDCPNGECPITDCDADGVIDADGTASLCANGQTNCGDRVRQRPFFSNAFPCISTAFIVLNEMPVVCRTPSTGYGCAPTALLPICSCEILSRASTAQVTFWLARSGSTGILGSAALLATSRLRQTLSWRTKERCFF